MVQASGGRGGEWCRRVVGETVSGRRGERCRRVVGGAGVYTCVCASLCVCLSASGVKGSSACMHVCMYVCMCVWRGLSVRVCGFEVPWHTLGGGEAVVASMVVAIARANGSR